MGIELNSLIRVYDDVLSPDLCRYLIDFYEQNPDARNRVDNAQRPSFSQMNFTEIHHRNEESKKAHAMVVAGVNALRGNYYGFVDARCFPADHDLERFRIKKYQNDGNDLFDTHVDVRNRESAGRFLSFIFYLNEVEKGGETIFFTGVTVKPKAGRVVVFPPLWMFPHKGCAPISGSKYILSTYLLYR